MNTLNVDFFCNYELFPPYFITGLFSSFKLEYLSSLRSLLSKVEVLLASVTSFETFIRVCCNLMDFLSSYPPYVVPSFRAHQGRGEQSSKERKLHLHPMPPDPIVWLTSTRKAATAQKDFSIHLNHLRVLVRFVIGVKVITIFGSFRICDVM